VGRPDGYGGVVSFVKIKYQRGHKKYGHFSGIIPGFHGV